MASIFGNLLKRVVRVRIDGQINQKLYKKLYIDRTMFYKD